METTIMRVIYLLTVVCMVYERRGRVLLVRAYIVDSA